jgi:hypothetical protein
LDFRNSIQFSFAGYPELFKQPHHGFIVLNNKKEVQKIISVVVHPESTLKERNEKRCEQLDVS